MRSGAGAGNTSGEVSPAVDLNQINVSAAPSGEGCTDCDTAQPPGWWLHLRRCAMCGHVGCCDSSPAQHARGHFVSTGHAIIQSFEPHENWYYDFSADQMMFGPALAAPTAHPEGQSTPGPSGRVPANWRRLLNR
jgi:hypothetical protein